MRSALPIALILAAGPAMADTFGGFSGVDAPYLVNRDRVCSPLSVKDGTASGAPQCDKDVTADVIAKLSFKEPAAQRGPKATFAATASGRTLTVTNKASGNAVVTWTAPDPIGKVVEVYASQYEDRVAVAYTTRSLGKEVTNVVAFELIKTTGRDNTAQPVKPPPTGTTPPTPTPTPAPATDPKLDKAIAAAKKASKAKASAAWQAVLAIDKDNSEAQFNLAAIKATSKQTADAIAAIEKLSQSSRGDAIEWLIEARFDKAFAAIRAEPKFRTAVGLDRKPTTPYEKLMGFGGQWEQTGTSCEAPEVKLTAQRDRSVKVRIKTVCRGDSSELPFKGTWRSEGDGIILTFPTKGKASSVKDEAPCTFQAKGDENELTCVLDRDLEFTLLPTRR